MLVGSASNRLAFSVCFDYGGSRDGSFLGFQRKEVGSCAGFRVLKEIRNFSNDGAV